MLYDAKFFAGRTISVDEESIICFGSPGYVYEQRPGSIVWFVICSSSLGFRLVILLASGAYCFSRRFDVDVGLFYKQHTPANPF